MTTGELVARTADGAAQTDKALAPSPANVLRLLHIFDAGKPMAIMSKIRKQGGAAVLTIPPALLKLMELDVGAQVTLSVERGKLVAEPAMSKRKRYSLSELLKGSAGMKKLTAEAAWAQDGGPVGREIG
jgi:antitoxin ChpS